MASPLEALADPVRLRIVRHLAERGPAALQDIAQSAHVHFNTARHHIAALEAAGILLKEPSPHTGRGRPHLRFKLAEGCVLPTGDYRALAELLAAVLLRTLSSPERIAAIGYEFGRLAVGPVASPADLPRLLERFGFQAALEGSQLKLSACPCPLVAPGNPQVLCRLMLSVVDGALSTAGSDLRVATSQHQPERRCCSVMLKSGLSAPER